MQGFHPPDARFRNSMLLYHLDGMKTVPYANGTGTEDVWSYRHCRGNYYHTFMRKVFEGDKILNIDIGIQKDCDLETALVVQINHALSATKLASFDYNPDLKLHVFDVNRDSRAEFLLHNKITNGCKLKFLSSDGQPLSNLKKLWCPKWMTDARTIKLIKKKTLGYEIILSLCEPFIYAMSCHAALYFDKCAQCINCGRYSDEES